MQVILLERVAKLGQMGEVVDVKPGYARNYLAATEQSAVCFQSEHRSFRRPQSPA